VADAFDAMTSDRPYRRALSVEAAFAEVDKNSGIQFDPNCATAFLRIRHRLEREMYPQTEDEDTIRSRVMQATAG
jgi:HD-GYP domain-containing protein (c-di-GMP phosphodiesterase class II)